MKAGLRLTTHINSAHAGYTKPPLISTLGSNLMLLCPPGGKFYCSEVALESTLSDVSPKIIKRIKIVANETLVDIQ